MHLPLRTEAERVLDSGARCKTGGTGDKMGHRTRLLGYAICTVCVFFLRPCYQYDVVWEFLDTDCLLNVCRLFSNRNGIEHSVFLK